jgi:outer membrane protein assembly factor BamB
MATALSLLTGCSRGKSSESIVASNTAEIENAPDVVAAQGDWPWWRGPQHNGVASSSELPVELNEASIRWQVSIPGRGHASPIVVGNQVIVATADENAKTISLISYNTADGKEQWTTPLHSGSFMRSHAKNSHASATPACDGQQIYTASMIDNGIQVAAVTLDGKIVWNKTAGNFSSRHGYGSSPCIYKSLVIINGDNDGGGWLAALDRKSGRIVWRVQRSSNSSFATPVVAHLNDQDQLLVSGHNQLISYRPADGTMLWESKGTSPTTANTVAWNNELVFTSGGYPETGVMAVRADGSGKVVWENKIKEYVPSPLVVGDKLIVTQDTGIVMCLSADTGTELWKQRLEGECSGSPIAVGDTILQITEKGVLYAYQYDPEYSQVAKLKLDGMGMSTPVVCDQGLFVRTDKWLYCFAAN